MSTYTVTSTPPAGREFAKLPAAVQPAIAAALRGLAADPRPPGCKKLKGQPGWRIRVGDYRVIYDVEDSSQSVTITQIAHRRDVYR